MKLLLYFSSLFAIAFCGQVVIDASLVGRTFDGIGGLSGGGATSRLLIDYPEPYRSQILDYLFMPNFGASLQILKVEIGGDDFTSNGVEPSHMHTQEDENYERGYEWWLLQEALTRNPNIITYCLPWSFPGWIGEGPYNLPLNENQAFYQTRFLMGAKKHYGIEFDYIGIWNEKSWTADYVKLLRRHLDDAGFQSTKIVIGTPDFGTMAEMLLSDKELRNAAAVMGEHYPFASQGNSTAFELGIPLWSSEDDSTYFDATGTGCLARILNWNWVMGNMTATIVWNLITSYVEGDAWYGDSFMEASNPWSGSYNVRPPLWIAAHTTQFAEPGWSYLLNGTGSGLLPEGGSYVTLLHPNGIDFSTVIETMTTNHSQCIRSNPNWSWTVSPQNVTFQLEGGLESTQQVFIWKSRLFGEPTFQFEYQGSVQVNNGQITMFLEPDSIWTITTTIGQQKGSYKSPPPVSNFPIPYSDNFKSYSPSKMAKYFSDMAGSFAISDHSGRGNVLRQEVREYPVPWCTGDVIDENHSKYPISIIGDYDTVDVTIQVEFNIEENSQVDNSSGRVVLGARVHLPSGSAGYCYGWYRSGYFFEVTAAGTWSLWAKNETLSSGTCNVGLKTWHSMQLQVQGFTVTGWIDGEVVTSVKDKTFESGWISIGTGWHFASFDNFALSNPDS